MRFSNSEVASHVPNSVTGQTTFTETWTLSDRNGVAVATFTKDGSGNVTCVVAGTVTDGLGNVLAASPVSDTAYDATSWDAVTTIAPSKNAVRDKIEAITITALETAGSITPCADATVTPVTSITTKKGIITAIS